MLNRPLKVFAAGIFTETNTFSPIPTGYDSFDIVEAEDITSGRRCLSELPPFDHWQELTTSAGNEFHFGLFAYAQPAGVTTADAFTRLSDKLLSSVEAVGDIDIILLLLHGAMVAEGEDDCEGCILTRLREVVGDDIIIAVELDLHCHLTKKMAEHADLIISFKEYPHSDIAARGDELHRLSVATCRGDINPTQSIVDCNMLGLFPTSKQPLRNLVDQLFIDEQQANVLSCSLIHGFPYGDVKDAGARVLVMTDNDQQLAQSLASSIAQSMVDIRDEIGFSVQSLNQALQKAQALLITIQDSDRPIVIADQSDNAGGGAPSDSTFALRAVLEQGIKSVALGIFYDPVVVKHCVLAGKGARLTLRLGGKMGVSSGQPVDLIATVLDVKPNYIHEFPQQQGRPVTINIGDTVSLLCEGIYIVVSEERTQCFSPSIFTDLSIPLETLDLCIVKSSQHFYQAFSSLTNHIIYMAADGALNPNLRELNFKKLATHQKHPWNNQPSIHGI